MAGTGPTFAYEVKHSSSTSNKQEVFITTNPNITLKNLQPGQVITVTVTALGLGYKKKSAPVSTTFTVPAFAAAGTPVSQQIVLPEDPQGVTLEMNTGEQVILRWIAPKGLNANSLIAIIRHAPETDGTGTWPNSTLLSDSITASTTQAVLPKIDGEYLIKFRNNDLQLSENAVSAILDQPDPLPLLNITTVREDTTTPPFQGQFEDAFYSDEYDGIVIDGDQTIDEITDVDDVGSFDFTGTQLLTGRYYFTNIVDLGAKFSAKFKRTLKSRGIYPADLMDSKTENIDR